MNQQSRNVWKCAGLAGMLVLIPRFSVLAQQQDGTIRGTVHVPAVVQVAPRTQAPHYRTYLPTAVLQPKANVKERPDVANVVVSLEGKGLEGGGRPDSVPVLNQKDQMFIPHVLPIPKGTSVRIVNQDKIYHNVFSLSAAKKFNIGRRPTGEAVPVLFDKAGVVQVFCDIHSNMSAFVVVLDNSFFAQPDDDGHFELSNVPPGHYTIRAWHERFSAPSKEITVRAGETATVDFDLQ
jgi:plastocyanin